MNERQYADELGALIDNYTDDVFDQLPHEDAAFAAYLLELRDQTHADDLFADALEARLEAVPRSPFENRPHILNRRMNSRNEVRGRLVYAMATVAAALAIFVAALLALPALRGLTGPDTETVPTVTAALPLTSTLSGYTVASTSLRSGFRVMGYALNADEFAVHLIESAVTAYVNLMSSE